MTRVLVHSNCLFKGISGIGRYTCNLLNAMAQLDESVQFCLDQTPAQHFLHLLNNNTIYVNKNYDFSEFDVFWGPAHWLPLRKPNGMKTILTIHDLVFKRYPQFMSIKSRIASHFYFRRSVMDATSITCVSKSTLEDLRYFFPNISDRAEIVYPTIAPKSPTVSANLGYPFMLFVGTFEPRKNILNILIAFRDIEKKLCDGTKLVIAGKYGWGMPQLASIIDQLGLQKSVVILQGPDDELINKLFHDCKFLVFPSFYEGFGIPILEALRSGKAVLTSSVSSMPEVAGDAGSFVNPGAIDEISRAMLELSNNENKRRRLAERAPQQFLKFNSQKQGHKMLKIIKSL